MYKLRLVFDAYDTFLYQNSFRKKIVQDLDQRPPP